MCMPTKQLTSRPQRLALRSTLLMAIGTLPWNLPADMYILDGFSIVHRTDYRTANRQAFGTLTLLKNEYVPISWVGRLEPRPT